MKRDLVTTHERSGWSATADYTIASLSVQDAQIVTHMICDAGRDALAAGEVHRDLVEWTVQVFLPVSGERPAASCMPNWAP